MLDEQAREIALLRAVDARHADEDPQTTVGRARAFYDFLNPPEQDDAGDG